MCRSGDGLEGVRQIKIKAFVLRLKLLGGKTGELGIEEAESLSLVVMPRIDGSPLEVNGTYVQADCPAFITLNRIHVDDDDDDDDVVVFASSKEDRVKGWDGLSIEVHLGQYRLLRGIFHRHRVFNTPNNYKWKMECKCLLSSHFQHRLVRVREAQLCVTLHNCNQEEILLPITTIINNITTNKFKSNSRKLMKGRSCLSKRCTSLQDIPEVEMESEEEEEEDNCNCHHESCNWNFVYMASQTPDLTWAFNLSFGALCFGFAFLLSRASANKLRRSKFL